MLFAVMFLFLGVLTVGALLLVSLRRWGMEDARTEARLHSTTAHTVAYVVPAGQDPATLRGALANAGFTSVIDAGETERVIVECEPSDHVIVKEIIEHVHPAGFADR
jgi:hypothetical protein